MRTIIFAILVALLATSGCRGGSDNPSPTPTPVPTGISFTIEASGDNSEIIKALFTEVKNQGGLSEIEVRDNDKPGFATLWVDGTNKQLRVAKAAYLAMAGALELPQEQPSIDIREIRRYADELFEIYFKALKVLDLIAVVSENDDIIELKEDIEKIGTKIILAIEALFLIFETEGVPE